MLEPVKLPKKGVENEYDIKNEIMETFLYSTLLLSSISMLVTLVTARFFVTYLMFAFEKISILPNLIVIKIT